MKRLSIIAVVVVLAAVVGAQAQPATAHTHAQLHAALANLRDTNAAQTQRLNSQAQQIASLRTQISNLRARVIDNEDTLFALLCVNIDVWNNMNAEPNLTLAYPALDPCPAAASTSALTRLARLH